MSLSSILSSYGLAGSLSPGGTSTQTTTPAAKLTAAKIAATATSSGTGKTTAAGDTVVISAATLAKADNAKDFTLLSKQVRATLDKQYAGGTSKNSPGLSGMTGRALAAIALNKAGIFSATETAAARTAIPDQAHTGFTGAMSSGGGISGMTTYSKQVVSQYDGMSSEEHQARGWTDKFRASNATFGRALLDVGASERT